MINWQKPLIIMAFVRDKNLQNYQTANSSSFISAIPVHHLVRSSPTQFHWHCLLAGSLHFLHQFRHHYLTGKLHFLHQRFHRTVSLSFPLEFSIFCRRTPLKPPLSLSRLPHAVAPPTISSGNPNQLPALILFSLDQRIHNIATLIFSSPSLDQFKLVSWILKC